MPRWTHSPANSPPPDAVAKQLSRWAAQPLRQINRRTVFWTGVTMILMLVASQRDAEQVSFIRNAAMFFIGVHGFLHVAILLLLERLGNSGVVEADMARRAYLAPHRITNLDLAIAWAAFAALVSFFRIAFSGSAGG